MEPWAASIRLWLGGKQAVFELLEREDRQRLVRASLWWLAALGLLNWFTGGDQSRVSLIFTLVLSAAVYPAYLFVAWYAYWSLRLVRTEVIRDYVSDAFAVSCVFSVVFTLLNSLVLNQMIFRSTLPVVKIAGWILVAAATFFEVRALSAAFRTSIIRLVLAHVLLTLALFIALFLLIFIVVFIITMIAS